jgi:hypothetical protein
LGDFVSGQLRPFSVCVLLAVMAVLAGGALFGGVALLIDPTGEILQLPVGILERSPFSSFLIPALALMVVLGIAPAVVVLGVWKRKHWAWRGCLLVSLATLIWMATEIAMVGFHPDPPLQAIFSGVGIALLVLTLLPTVRRHLARSAEQG